MKASQTESGNVNVMEKVTEGYIQPMQAFFVKKNGSAGMVNFTASMTVDSKKSRGTASDGTTISLRAANAKGASCARVTFQPESTDEYDNTEDAEMISDANTAGIPQIYTVAGDKAVALNTLPDVSWLPLGILAEDESEVEVAVSGMSRNVPDLYLYDALNANFTPLSVGTTAKMQSNVHGRYYLTSHSTLTGISAPTSSDVHIYRLDHGQAIVQAVTPGVLSSVDIYSLSGSRLSSATINGSLSWSAPVGQDLIVVKVTTTDGRVIVKKL